MDGNAWAQNAPVLMLSVAKRHFDLTGEINRHAPHDVGLAVANLVLQAESLGLVCHQMAGFSPEKAHELLGIPQDRYEPMAVIAIGYQGSPDSLDDKLKERELAPRERQPLQAMAFTHQWETAYPLCFT
jgi:nitroreductase